MLVNSNCLVAVTLVFVQLLVQTAEATTSYYLTDLCHKKNFNVILTSFSGRTASGNIFVHRENETFPSNLTCKVTIRPTKIYRHGVMVNVEKPVVPEPAKRDGGTMEKCEDYRMEFLSSHSSIDERYKNITRCLTDGPLTFQSASSVHMYFHFNNDNSNSSSFRITFTNYHIDVCKDRKGFSCANTNCIWKALVCDGTNNCGDNSDEEHLECGHKGPSLFGTLWYKPTDMMSFFGLALACVTLFAVSMSALYLCGKTLRHQRTSTATRPTDIATWDNEAPSYPAEKNGYAAFTNQDFRGDKPPPYPYT